MSVLNNLKSINKDLYKYYKSAEKQTSKKIAAGKSTCLDEFVLQLKMMRDVMLLSAEGNTEGEYTTAFKTIMNAVNEYEESITCITKYYKTSNNVVVQLDPEKTAEAVVKEYSEEKLKHWATFWRLVALGMEDWLKYASI